MLENMAHDIRKEVSLKIKKSEINFDMNVYSQFFSTLIHIIRNSLDHGIEEKELREVLGKKKSGLIEISCKKEKDKNIIINCHCSIRFKNGTYKNLINTVNAAILGNIAKNVVTDVGDPS